MRITLPMPPNPATEECDPPREGHTYFLPPTIPAPEPGTSLEPDPPQVEPLLTERQNARPQEELRRPFRADHGDGHPINFLAYAALAFIDGNELWGNAYADLAVTGRRAYTRFKVFAENPERFERLVREQVTTIRPAASSVASAVSRALDRAFNVAWILAGQTRRDTVGWIAVSSEDDFAHRPVNVETAPYPQHEFDVDVQVTPQTRHASLPHRRVRTRYIVANPGDRLSPRTSLQSNLRALPSTRPLHIDPQARLLVFLHGHDSRLEECLSLVEPLAELGFTLISLDLPGSAYASHLEHVWIARDDDHVIKPNDQFDDQYAPILEFLEQFVIDFVQTLDREMRRVSGGPGILHQIEGFMGGSLGGNLSLRLGYVLGRRGDDGQRIVDLAKHQFLANTLPWSAASVWTRRPDIALNLTLDRMRDRRDDEAVIPLSPTPSDLDRPGPEGSPRRHQFFQEAFAIEWHESIAGLRAQPEYWYRDGWDCKPAVMQAAKVDRFEVYNRSYRRWRWRVAFEQILFSHRAYNNWSRITSRMMLMAGAGDDYQHVNIYSYTRQLAERMVTTPGTSRLLEETGHSIYIERPRMLSRLIAEFLPPPRPVPALGVDESWDTWRALPGPWSATPVLAIQDDGRLVMFARGVNHRWRYVKQAEVNGRWRESLVEIAGGLRPDETLGGGLAVANRRDGRLEVVALVVPRNRYLTSSQAEANSDFEPWREEDDFAAVGAAAEDGLWAGDEAVVVDDERRGLVAGRLANKIQVRAHQEAVTVIGDPVVQLVGRPVIANVPELKALAFARDREGVMRWVQQVPERRWDNRWQTIAGGPIASDAAVALNITNQLEVFARSPIGDLVGVRRSMLDGSFPAWQPLVPHQPADMAAGAAPVVARNGWGELQVFVRWQDGSIRYRRQILPDVGEDWTWTDWKSLGGDAASDPAVSPQANGALVVAYVGTDGAVHYSTQNTTRAAMALRVETPVLSETTDVHAGETNRFVVTVQNRGLQAVANVTVQLYAAELETDGSPPPLAISELDLLGDGPEASSPWQRIGAESGRLAAGHPMGSRTPFRFSWTPPLMLRGSLALVAVAFPASDVSAFPSATSTVDALTRGTELVAARTFMLRQSVGVIIRDAVDDDGRVGSLAWGGRSPDIIVLPTPLSNPNDPTGPLGDLSHPRTSDRARTDTNVVYVRLLNQTGQTLSAEVRLVRIPMRGTAGSPTPIGAAQSVADIPPRGWKVASFDWNGVSAGLDAGFVLVAVARVPAVPGLDSFPEDPPFDDAPALWRWLNGTEHASRVALRFVELAA